MFVRMRHESDVLGPDATAPNDNASCRLVGESDAGSATPALCRHWGRWGDEHEDERPPSDGITPPRRGVSWGGRAGRGAIAAISLTTAPVLLASAPTGVSAAASPPDVPLTDEVSRALVDVIVREQPGAGNIPERAIEAAGGSVERRLSIIDGFSATVPENEVAGLRAAPGVFSVTTDARVSLSGSSSVADQPARCTPWPPPASRGPPRPASSGWRWASRAATRAYHGTVNGGGCVPGDRRDRLTTLDCGLGQGFLFSEPVGPEEMKQLLGPQLWPKPSATSAA
jgi:hypothetical protein